ncbi:MAG: YkgJ family cysteine cluster protein [Bacteroidia bacterium]
MKNPPEEIDIEPILTIAKGKRADTKAFFRWIKRKKPKNLDEAVGELHHEVFADFDCLTCGNCCKTTSPVFTDKDIDRIAKHERMKPSQFVDQYLHLDEEGDYVLNESPCHFLAADNYCLIYDVRPKACREYPHTNRKRFRQVLGLTEKNAELCPATHKIVERLKEEMDWS